MIYDEGVSLTCRRMADTRRLYKRQMTDESHGKRKMFHRARDVSKIVRDIVVYMRTVWLYTVLTHHSASPLSLLPISRILFILPPSHPSAHLLSNHTLQPSASIIHSCPTSVGSLTIAGKDPVRPSQTDPSNSVPVP